MLQAEEGRTGAEDVVSAGESQGTDGAAGGADEAAQGDTSCVQRHTGGFSSVRHLPLCVPAITSLTFLFALSSVEISPFSSSDTI